MLLFLEIFQSLLELSNLPDLNPFPCSLLLVQLTSHLKFFSQTLIFLNSTFKFRVLLFIFLILIFSPSLLLFSLGTPFVPPSSVSVGRISQHLDLVFQSVDFGLNFELFDFVFLKVPCVVGSEAEPFGFLVENGVELVGVQGGEVGEERGDGVGGVGGGGGGGGVDGEVGGERRAGH